MLKNTYDFITINDSKNEITWVLANMEHRPHKCVLGVSPILKGQFDSGKDIMSTT